MTSLILLTIRLLFSFLITIIYNVAQTYGISLRGWGWAAFALEELYKLKKKIPTYSSNVSKKENYRKEEGAGALWLPWFTCQDNMVPKYLEGMTEAVWYDSIAVEIQQWIHTEKPQLQMYNFHRTKFLVSKKTWKLTFFLNFQIMGFTY